MEIVTKADMSKGMLTEKENITGKMEPFTTEILYKVFDKEKEY